MESLSTKSTNTFERTNFVFQNACRVYTRVSDGFQATVIVKESPMFVPTFVKYSPSTSTDLILASNLNRMSL